MSFAEDVYLEKAEEEWLEDQHERLDKNKPIVIKKTKHRTRRQPARTFGHFTMIDFSALKNPFSPADLEWRIQRGGVTKNGEPWAFVLAYVDNRAIMDRLDTVVGPENWRNEFIAGPQGGILCGISIRLNGEWITKWDGADNTDIEAVKGGLSGAMKRAAVHWGIGRYLYRLEATFAIIDEKNGAHRNRIKAKDGSYITIRWNPPTLPSWALPAPKSSTSSPALEIEKTEDDYLEAIFDTKTNEALDKAHKTAIAFAKSKNDAGMAKRFRAATKKQHDKINDKPNIEAINAALEKARQTESAKELEELRQDALTACGSDKDLYADIKAEFDDLASALETVPA